MIMCGTIPTTRHASAGDPGHPARPPGAAVRVRPLTDSRGNDAISRWPLVSFLELGALPGAVPCARLHTRQVLWEWGLQESADTTELLVSELVTNAVHITRAAAAGTPVRLWLVSDRAQVVIWVWDASPLPPARTYADGDAEHGRGLMLVQAISTKWGWDFPQGLGGKAVWAQIGALLQPMRHSATPGRRRHRKAAAARDSRVADASGGADTSVLSSFGLREVPVAG
jgi:anti-sigma regulatory factor (Ser/Thr protein kinase)